MSPGQRSSTKFAVKDGDTSLLGVARRTKTLANIEVYAIGLYVADSALYKITAFTLPSGPDLGQSTGNSPWF
jgi:hypothetical protein